MRTSFAVVVAIGLLAVAGAQTAGAEQATIGPSVRAALLSDAISTARIDGDAHPYDIQAVATTQARAIRLEPGTTAPTCEASPACADGLVYVVAMRGRFTCGTCSHPPGATVGPGTVIRLVYDASSMFQTTFALSDEYPRLSAAGTPVLLARGHARPRRR
ncbi:MAG TPA: hypothetical protein VH081_10465 [Solirubrobacteraceae bacterium]|jgi:hypothetical protein|nr:hypothetical protein [Solirubrobacteraceae bacterium]